MAVSASDEPRGLDVQRAVDEEVSAARCARSDESCCLRGLEIN